MRVCLFTPTFLPSVGGAELAGDRILRGLQARGHDVQVLCQDHGDPGGPPYPVTRYRRPHGQNLWPEWLSRHVRRLYKQRPFDVMLAFYGYPTGYAAARVKQTLGFKLVVSARGADLYPNFHALKKLRVRATIRAGYRGADRIISLSDWIDERLRQVAGPDLPPIDRVLNGIDLEAFDRELGAAESITPPFDLQPGKFVLHLARVGPVKRQDLAVEALGKTIDRFRQHGMKYVFVGDGESLHELSAKVESMRIGDAVHFLGRQTGVNKYWLLRHAHAFVTTSREEGMPNAVIEAIGAGLPVLASDIGPHTELMSLTKAGWTFRFPDADDLAKQLSRLLEDDLTDYREAAAACRSMFSLDTMIDGYERSLNAALGSSGQAST
jgi:glycosyltransferase involved in cell wall biosynthesis